MKLIIQIPCFDEEQTLPGNARRPSPGGAGMDTVEWLVIDDGSTDRTVEVARERGVDHIVRLTEQSRPGRPPSSRASTPASSSTPT